MERAEWAAAGDPRQPSPGGARQADYGRCEADPRGRQGSAALRRIPGLHPGRLLFRLTGRGPLRPLPAGK